MLTLYKCNICEKMFSTSKSLQKHISFVHTIGNRHKCKECDKSFQSAEMRLRHEINTHFPELRYKCDICGNRKPTLTSLQKHKIDVHQGNNQTFTCDKCEKKFKSKNYKQ